MNGPLLNCYEYDRNFFFQSGRFFSNVLVPEMLVKIYQDVGMTIDYETAKDLACKSLVQGWGMTLEQALKIIDEFKVRLYFVVSLFLSFFFTLSNSSLGLLSNI